MKTINLITVFMYISLFTFAQSNSYNVWEDATNANITWETSGHTCFADVLT